MSWPCNIHKLYVAVDLLMIYKLYIFAVPTERSSKLSLISLDFVEDLVGSPKPKFPDRHWPQKGSHTNDHLHRNLFRL